MLGCWAITSPQYWANSSPIVCAVLALDSGTISLDSRPNSPTSSSQCLPHMASLNKRNWNPRCHLVAGEFNMSWQHLFYFKLFTQFNCIKKIRQSCECWAVGPALQSNISNCLVLIPHRQLGNFLRVYCLVYKLYIHWVHSYNRLSYVYYTVLFIYTCPLGVWPLSVYSRPQCCDWLLIYTLRTIYWQCVSTRTLLLL